MKNKITEVKQNNRNKPTCINHFLTYKYGESFREIDIYISKSFSKNILHDKTNSGILINVVNEIKSFKKMLTHEFVFSIIKKSLLR